MERDIEVMAEIMEEKAKEVSAAELQPLDPEGEEMSEHKRFTIDMVGVPTDPLR